VSVTATATATVTATPETPNNNIVPNGDFESGTLAGWTVADNTTAAVVSPGGSNSSFSLKIGPLDNGGQQAPPFPWHRVWTTLSPSRSGANYTCTFEHMFDQYILGAHNELPAGLIFVNGARTQNFFLRDSAGVWSTWRAQFTYTSEGEDVLEFAVYTGQNATVGENYFSLDNIASLPAASE
jgi:hypothetical protein